MTNLYDFLRLIQSQATRAVPGAAPLGNGKSLYITISSEAKEWLDHYMQAPDTELHFKSYPTGEYKILEDLPPELAEQYIAHGKQVDGKPAEPYINFDLGLKGAPDDVFCLLTEGMMQNPNFANMVVGAARFYLEHVPTCPHCEQHHNGHFPADCPDLAEFKGWDFHKRKSKNHETR